MFDAAIDNRARFFFSEVVCSHVVHLYDVAKTLMGYDYVLSGNLCLLFTGCMFESQGESRLLKHFNPNGYLIYHVV
jgi:hypothetical protein